MSHGLSFLSSYTWSKSLDNSSDFSNDVSPNPLNVASYMKGPSDFDQTQRFIQSWLYDLPVGHGRQFLSNAPRAVDYVLGGWALAGIFTRGTGFPFTPVIGSDLLNIGTGSQRPNIVGDWHVANPTIHEWFNPAAFAKPAAYTFGDGGRNYLRGPLWSNLDFSIQKQFRVTEGSHFTLRVEMFDTANHTNFSLPNATVTSTSAGTITGTVPGSTPSREIQMALRYDF